MFDNKVVIVTGGTGSFGKEFSKIVLREFHPKKLIIFSRDELKQHEMRQVYPDTGDSPLRYFIGDVRDRERLYRAFNGVDIVVHAAALKQVPACEYNPIVMTDYVQYAYKLTVGPADSCGTGRLPLDHSRGICLLEQTWFSEA